MDQMPSLGRIETRRSAEIARSPWGVNFSTPQVEDWTPVLARMADLGVKWARVNIYWGAVEGERGQYDWRRSDHVVDFCRANGIEVYAQTGLGNAAYLGVPRGVPPTRDAQAMAAYTRFLQAAGERYRGRITYWEIANEPNVRTFWQPEPDAVEYAEVLKAAAAALRAVDPGVKIVGGVTAFIDLPYTRELLAAGAASHFDVFCYHPYRTVPEGYSAPLVVRAQSDLSEVKLTIDKRDIQGLSFFKEFEELQRLLRKRGFSGPVWQGEAGYPSTENTIHWRGDGPWGENIQAKFLMRRLLSDWLAGAGMSAYFLMLDFSSVRDPQLARGFHAHGTNTKGLLTLEDLSPKPAYFAFQRFCAVLSEIERVEQAPWDLEITRPGSLPAAATRDDALGWVIGLANGSRAFVYWMPCGMRETIQPAEARVRIAQQVFAGAHQPVLIDLIEDGVYPLSIGEHDGWTVLEGAPLKDYPLVVLERAAVPLRDR